ncbi:MAG TPA: tripartite tricarboxylate transporter substrate-binding protein [Burkholderiales bacterium]|nr:tripartite tricarboxylate transporter substrate-binding protein [Burkholderiales bacterium]
MKPLIQAGFALALLLAGGVLAQDYPARPVRIVVPNAPGSSVDTMSRILSTRLAEALGGSVVVENRDGAGGLIGMDAGRKAVPDGYTLICVSNGSGVIAPLLKKARPYETARDFELIGTFAITPNVLVVNPHLPVNSVSELIEYARANQSSINMASAGIGSQSHLAGALLMTMANFDSLHVPHKGGSPSVASVAAGQTHWTLTPAPAAMSQVKAGRLRVLAHSLPRRSALLADMPAIAETVAGYDFNGWAGLIAPKGTPRPIVDRVHAAMIKTLAVPEVRDGLAAQGADLFPGNAEEFRKFLARDIANTERVMKAAQLQPE